MVLKPLLATNPCWPQTPAGHKPLLATPSVARRQSVHAQLCSSNLSRLASFNRTSCSLISSTIFSTLYVLYILYIKPS